MFTMFAMITMPLINAPSNANPFHHDKASLLETRHQLDDPFTQDHVRALMRLRGTRLDVCWKNIHEKKYAFNSFQLGMLPKAYRPPGASAGAGQA